VTLAKTEASGGATLRDEVLAFTSSFESDLRLLREDLVGSLGHLVMLARTGILPPEDAETIRGGLVALWEEAAAGTLELPREEDVHMAVEVALTQRLGPVAGRLHTARSRNDQVALDLRLHVREQIATVLEKIAAVLEALAQRAEQEGELLLPSYTHRQRAQPITLGYWICSYGAMLARDVEAFLFALEQTDRLPLGVGAIAGTSLPIDRELTRQLLQFSDMTWNGLDTVADRDFALDFAYATARMLLHTGKLSADLVDFSSAEFGFVRLDGTLACGSSMMPQKRNPDVFELIRGRTGKAVGNLMGLFTVLKGLPGGYNRDLQEDRGAVLDTGPLACAVLEILGVALPLVEFQADRCAAALESDFTQATDVADALVRKGLPFREAYRLVGALVRRCQEAGHSLSAATLELARQVDERFDEEVLASASVSRSVERKASRGSTGPLAVAHQIEAIWDAATRAREAADALPRLDALFDSLRRAHL
jgi:argininosuccinate lyase